MVENTSNHVIFSDLNIYKINEPPEKILYQLNLLFHVKSVILITK